MFFSTFILCIYLYILSYVSMHVSVDVWDSFYVPQVCLFCAASSKCILKYVIYVYMYVYFMYLFIHSDSRTYTYTKVHTFKTHKVCKRFFYFILIFFLASFPFFLKYLFSFLRKYFMWILVWFYSFFAIFENTYHSRIVNGILSAQLKWI